MSKRYDVVGLGNAMVDVISRIDDSLLRAIDFPKGAMTLVEEQQSDAIYDRLGPATERSGGSVANSIAGVGSAGGRAGFNGRVRNDQFGRIFAHDLRTGGVDFNGSIVDEGPATGRCLVMVSPDAERTMATYLGAGQNFCETDVDEAMIADAQIVFLEGYLWDRPAAKDAFRKAMRLAAQAGGRPALTLSDSFCVERHRASFREIVRGEVDILIANEGELVSLYQTETLEQALVAARAEVSLTAVTRGKHGAIVATADELAVIPGTPIANVIDRTGAGDMFAAGFLLGVARGLPLAECGKAGCAAAERVIQEMGPRVDLGGVL